MNAVQRAYAAQAQGLSDLDLNAIINRGFDFGNLFIQSKYAKDAARFTGGNNAFQLQPTAPAGGGLTAAQYEELLRRQQSNDDLASASINAEGIKFGNTRVSWPTIAIAGLAFYLVQSPGFTRRRTSRAW